LAGGLSFLGAEFGQLEDQTQGLVDRLCSRKRIRHIRSQENEIRSLAEPFGVLALYACSQQFPEVIPDAEIVTSFAVGFLLHRVITMTNTLTQIVYTGEDAR